MLSAGLIIGGKDLAVEQERVAKMNILVATPGRLLQHMDQTAGFECDNLQILGRLIFGSACQCFSCNLTLKSTVLDEADRILDMGFQKELNAIVENLPKQRQTLLFSATQTKSIKDLARLSLKVYSSSICLNSTHNHVLIPFFRTLNMLLFMRKLIIAPHRSLRSIILFVSFQKSWTYYILSFEVICNPKPLFSFPVVIKPDLCLKHSANFTPVYHCCIFMESKSRQSESRSSENTVV